MDLFAHAEDKYENTSFLYHFFPTILVVPN